MTIALVPLGLISVPVENLQLYVVNVLFVRAMPVAYAALIHWGSREHGFKRWEVAVLDWIYVVYVAVVAFWVLDLA